jgi:hypothetical protein
VAQALGNVLGTDRARLRLIAVETQAEELCEPTVDTPGEDPDTSCYVSPENFSTGLVVASMQGWIEFVHELCWEPAGGGCEVIARCQAGAGLAEVTVPFEVLSSAP